VNFLRSILGLGQSHKDEVKLLKARLDESEKNIEKLLDMVNILATFDEKLASDVRTVVSHIALMEISIMNGKARDTVSLKRKSNDDDIIN
jgi:hypothetical protein